MEADFTFQVVISVISVIVCPIFCSIIMYFGKKYWQRKLDNSERTNNLKVGVQALLRDRLLQGCRYYQIQGYSTHNARVNLSSMHDAYVSLGGNSIEIQEFENFLKLPHKKEDHVD